jgi:hypothetical protein
MSSDKQTPNQSNEPSSLETDIAALTSLVASTSVVSNTNGDGTVEPETVDEEELGMEEVEKLIRRIEAANDIADGVEDKLDGILQHLDGLLNSLEATGEAKESGGPAEPQSDR